MEAFYKKTILVVLALHLLFIFSPWWYVHSDKNVISAALLSEAGFLNGGALFAITFFLIIGYLGSYLGMYFFQSWARSLYMIILILEGLTYPFYGVSIFSGVESLLGYVVTLGNGFLIAIAFFTSVGQKFAKKESTNSGSE